MSRKQANRFDWIAFADYSGAMSPAEQRKHIAWAVDDGLEAPRVVQGMTRTELTEAAAAFLLRADREGKRVILGFDHNYGFPCGFHEAVHGERPRDWRQMLDGFVRTVWPDGRWEPKELERWKARDWARDMNERIALTLGAAAGPFWGTLFARRPGPELFAPDYRLPDGTVFRLRERRLAEERLRRLKPAYQLGGIGTVGQQSLYGQLHLYGLLERCRAEGVPLHVWPMDGTEVPEDHHVLAEVYPSMHHAREDGPRTDAGDALACVRWLRTADRSGELAGLMTPVFTPEERERVRLEGWVLGLLPHEWSKKP
ncbi:hypothetical protein [Gorillibacterium sp. sgz5001074]|uniref:hypothetical protein n=1 Tax=Gorillibacterium sp. sgz5001074 TaxID=3446695 RepID=UPI003F67D7C9